MTHTIVTCTLWQDSTEAERAQLVTEFMETQDYDIDEAHEVSDLDVTDPEADLPSCFIEFLLSRGIPNDADDDDAIIQRAIAQDVAAFARSFEENNSAGLYWHEQPIITVSYDDDDDDDGSVTDADIARQDFVDNTLYVAINTIYKRMRGVEDDITGEITETDEWETMLDAVAAILQQHGIEPGKFYPGM